MKRKGIKILIFILAAAMAMQIPALAAFPDVAAGVWYEKYVETLSSYGIISGCEDGAFHAENTLRRGEFIKLIYESCELALTSTDASIHWAEPYWNAANDAGLLDGVGIACTAEALNGGISRYEMAGLAANVMTKQFRESEATVTEPGSVITDYASIPSGYVRAVEQVYAKGVITGYSDGSFGGTKTLTRGEATAVIYRMLFTSERKPASFGTQPVDPVQPSDPGSSDYTPFALYIREEGLVNAWGKPTPELREMLFGDSEKTYFENAEEAAPYMEDLTVQIWRINSSGAKYSTKATITVHKLVAADVKKIFEEIYNSPEKFPIKNVGGARFTDDMRHAWGCAIDINYNENAYGHYEDGEFICSTGAGWWPGENEYSITANGSVVTAFAKYGWGWGGQGFSGGTYDYMHFSILKSGG